MSTKTKTTPGTTLKWLFYGIGIIIFIFAINSSVKSCKSESDKKQTEDRTEGVSDGNKKLPYTYTEIYTLKMNKTIRVIVPSGYSYTCSGGGKKYFHQAQNSQKGIMGDGSYHDAGKHVAYFDLSYYDEEITVVCEFKKL